MRYRPDDGGEVGLVQRVYRSDVGEPLAPPELPPLDERMLEIGVGVSGEHRQATLVGEQ